MLGPDKESLCERTQVTLLALLAGEGAGCLEKKCLAMKQRQLVQLLQAPCPGKHQELSMAVCRAQCRIPDPLTPAHLVMADCNLNQYTGQK